MFTSDKTYPGTKIMSDHNPVMAVIKLILKTIQKKRTNKKYDKQKLKDPVIQAYVGDKLSEYIGINQCSR